MIIKGDARGDGAQLGQYLVAPGENERVQVVEVRGVVATDVPGAVCEMEALAACTRMTEPLYHAQINSRARERLTDEQRAIAVDRLEAKLGLTAQPRVVVIHEKEGREHTHVVWSRTDVEHMRGIPISHNYLKHEQVARQLEREFGHERVQGAHAERDGRPRPERRPSRAEMQQADRTGMSPKDVKEQITEMWRRTDNGPSFAVALSQAGFVLARGDRRDFVVIDPKGGTHSLARRVEGATAKDIRARMVGVDPAQLPSVPQAKLQLARQARDGTRTREASREAPAPAPSPAPQADRGVSRGTPEGPGAPARIADAPARVASTLFDGIASIAERGLSGSGEAQSDQKREAPEPEPDPQRTEQEASLHTQQEAAKQRREDLRREFGRELPHEHEADIERGRGRERRRGE
jgi:hypothetical protein